jgi:hypothetical protein
VTVSDYNLIDKDDEEMLKEAIATVGPVAANIEAVAENFMFYKKGSYFYLD